VKNKISDLTVKIEFQIFLEVTHYVMDTYSGSRKLSSFLSTVCVQFVGSLNTDTAATAQRTQNIVAGGTLNIVLFTGLLPEKEDGDAGGYATQKAAEKSALLHLLGVLVDLDTVAAASQAAVSHIMEAAEGSHRPILTHL